MKPLPALAALACGAALGIVFWRFAPGAFAPAAVVVALILVITTWFGRGERR